MYSNYPHFSVLIIINFLDIIKEFNFNIKIYILLIRRIYHKYNIIQRPERLQIVD